MALEGKPAQPVACSVPAPGPSAPRDNWLDHLRERSYVHQFSPGPIPAPVLTEILEASGRTSSPRNLQPWKFIVVSEEAGRQDLLGHCHDPGPATGAPVLLVGLGDPSAWKRAPERLAELRRGGKLEPAEEARQLEQIRRQWGTGDTARVLAIAQTYAALQQIRLVALAFDVCSFWVDDFDAEAIGEALHVPADHVVVGVLGLGFCEKKMSLPNSSWRRAVFGEAYGLPWND